MRKICFLFLLLTLSFSIQAKDTDLNYYRPYNENIAEQAPVKIYAQKTGHCLQQSKRSIREDAWRCIADEKVYDPCFAKPYGSKKQVICPNAPWDGQSLQINLTEALDNSQHIPLNMSRNHYPWAIVLENNTRCLRVNTDKTYDNLPIRYRCDDKSALFGHIQRCDPRWTMLNVKDKTVTTATIKSVWF